MVTPETKPSSISSVPHLTTDSAPKLNKLGEGASSVDARCRKLVATRRGEMTARAAEKYGPTATSPVGDTSRDIWDYAINELAGMDRYCEMMENRLKMISGSLSHHEIWSGNYILTRIRKETEHQAFLLERFRDELLALGFLLGEPEAL